MTKIKPGDLVTSIPPVCLVLKLSTEEFGKAAKGHVYLALSIDLANGEIVIFKSRNNQAYLGILNDFEVVTSENVKKKNV